MNTKELIEDLMGLNSNPMLSVSEDGSGNISYRGTVRDERIRGRDVPAPGCGCTMIGQKRLENIVFLLEKALEEDIPGCYGEFGVWKGGASILAAHVLKGSGRKVYVADSFEGLPPAKPSKFPKDRGQMMHTINHLRVSLEEVQANFARYGLLDDNVIFLKGFFETTLPNLKDTFVVVRMDGDLYQSTWETLDNLYPQISPGGSIICDDYCLATAREACHDYREKHKITSEIHVIDDCGVWWRKD